MEINNALYLRSNSHINGIPVDCYNAYKRLLNSVIGYNKGIIDAIIKCNGNNITMPMRMEYIERYMSGFEFEYVPFCYWLKGYGKVEGCKVYDGGSGKLTVYYNNCASYERQRFTQVHELMHFLQQQDGYFLDFLTELVDNTVLPPEVIVKILERATDKATAMYLMPNKYFIKKYEEIRNERNNFEFGELKELANAFQVSLQTAKYRLNECEIYVPISI